MLRHRESRNLLAAIQRYQCNTGRGGAMARLSALRGKLAHAFWTAISGSDISRDARIDTSVRFPHLNGVVIHRDAVVEADCIIMQQVTLGQTAAPGAPHVHRGVYIGAGAKVLGAITIGAGARIGANAVVLRDVPADTTVAGIPAGIVRRRTDSGDDPADPPVSPAATR